ncbi:DUF6583 family protein [Sporosarcina limicola]|uniref:Uncharacterized protein n=1 Tax=Sporosarcina limicola TaxID=34101 RepID=A0A927MJD0_9BACL|nr:DUF6583 family protein [Sporosarcina limicola]MBE1554227.1 hypothetical protein [Sporosarcina limicola]
MENEVGKKKSPKLIIALVVTALVLLGGSASAFFILNKSPKIEYLMAEVNTIKQIGELFEDRYKNEMQWMETQKKKPVESTFDLSAEWNDPDIDYDMEEVQGIINSVTLSMRNVFDPVKKETEFEMAGELGSTEVKFGKVFITPEKLLVALPFMDDLIRFDDDDFGRLMKEQDVDYEGNEKLGLSQLFEDSFSTTEELNKHIEKEYLTYFFKELPETAFTSVKEDIEVFDKKINAKKIAMNLSEKEVKTLMKNIFKKVKEDKKLKKMLEEQLSIASFGSEISPSELTELFEVYDEGLDEAIKGIDSLSIPNGIQSTIWQHSNKIVKRDFAMEIGEFEGEEATIKVSGTQLLEKNEQKWKYTIAVIDADSDEEEVVKFVGDLKWKDQKAEDSITISADSVKLLYKGKEKLDGKKRTFTRSLSLADGDTSPKLVWSGSATHESDSMKANHAFTVTEQGMEEDMYNLNVKQQGKVVKKVDMPVESDDTVKLKDMNMTEIESYIEDDLGPKFLGWFMELMGDVESEIYN